MKFKLPTSFSPSVSQNSSAAVSKLSGGLVITDEPYNVSYGSALEVKNLWFDNDTLCKRFGQRALGLDTEGILAMSHIPYMGKLIYHAGTSIRAYDIENGNETIVYPTESQAALTMQGGSFIEFGDYLYYKNGHEFIKINAQLEASPVTGSAPVIYINCDPGTGEGDKLQSPNRLGGRFIIKFSSEGETNSYKSPILGFNSSNIKARFNGNEVSVKSANPISGTITLSEAVTAGVNRLEIELQKVDLDSQNKIMKCTYIERFGSDNEVRLICAGNPDEKNCFYSSGTLDAEYWPEESYNLAGSSDEAITGFGKLYSSLILFKEHSVWSVDYQLSAELVSFPARPINQLIGCDCPKTIQCIDNSLIWLNKRYGVCSLFSTVLRDEKNVRVLSKNINGTYSKAGLLNENSLENATSLDWNGRYFLFCNSRAYMLDYSLTPITHAQEELSWWYFENIILHDWCIDAHTLYYIGKDEHVLCTPSYDFRDFGAGFPAYWRSPPMAMGSTSRLKTFFDIYLTTSAAKPSYVKLTYMTDSNTREDKTPVSCLAFSLIGFSLDTFSLFGAKMAKTFHRKIGACGAQFISFIFENNLPGSDLNILSYEFTYKRERDVFK